MSSDIAQNYPYMSETESQRAAAVEATLARFEGLRDRVASETSPPVPPEDNVGLPRWWVWVCPEHDYTGRLHVAGYARERHAVYTVCDTCGKTFLR